MRDTADLEFLALQEAVAGRYSLQRELGRGGMGIVYLAREVKLERPVALKLLPPAYAAQRELRERFLREARTAARLSHPNIVPIHAVDEVGDFVFMVMAYIEGQTLEQRIRERGPVPVKEAARILREVSWALAYAHAQGVVHRDVKPANILLEAGSGRALVSDFGIAHVSDGAVLTGSREILGTAEYMSPEQASGDPVDGRSDIYALGVVGYQILSGRLPFEGPTVAATLAKQITQAAAPLTSVAPEIPAQIAQTIERCLAKDPAERFTDGEHIADALGRSLEQRTRIPQALRAFNEQVGEVMPWLAIMEVGAFYSLGGALIIGFDSLFAAGEVMTLAGLSLGAAPIAMLVYMARRLLAAGYSHDDVLRALRAELEERREALAAERVAEPSRFEQLARKVAIGGMGISLSSIAYYFVGPYFPAFETVVLPILVGLGIVTLGAGFYSATKHTLRNKKPAGRILKFWDSLVGRALFKLGGIKLEQPASAGAAYRPTALAIGMAADRLFEELPAEVRKSLGELPAVVRTLEQHADQMRQRVGELNALIANIEPAHAAHASRVADLRADVAGDLHAARAAAEQRLADVVAALETIRLQLLRMHAGVGSVERMTANLSSARELSRDVEHLIEGELQVGEALGLPRPRARGDTPVPV